MRTKEDEIKLINEKQDYYINELKKIILDEKYVKNNKYVNFNSATGTGKTVMITKLINSMPDFFFIITTLSKGQLHEQTKNKIKSKSLYNNFIVYGTSSYKTNTNLTKEDIINSMPKDKKIIWIKDESHIATNKWDEVLVDLSYLIINFSATNLNGFGIDCDFSETNMLRKINQEIGYPEDAIKKLIEVKEQHKNVINYNPCAIFRVVNEDIVGIIEDLCEQYNLKYINLINNNNYDMYDLCQDDNVYDVIINKYKITEGIDIKRAHVIYIDNKPGNVSTTVQVIGRARRNALLWRNDIDIFSPENFDLFEATMQCYIFYNVEETQLSINLNGEIELFYSNTISIQNYKPNTKIKVIDGKNEKGIEILELKNQTGEFTIILDKKTGFNIIKEDVPYYKEEKKYYGNFNEDIIVYNVKDYGYKEIYKMPKQYIIDSWLEIEKEITEIDYIKQSNIIKKEKFYIGLPVLLRDYKREQITFNKDTILLMIEDLLIDLEDLLIGLEGGFLLMDDTLHFLRYIQNNYNNLVEDEIYIKKGEDWYKDIDIKTLISIYKQYKQEQSSNDIIEIYILQFIKNKLENAIDESDFLTKFQQIKLILQDIYIEPYINSKQKKRKISTFFSFHPTSFFNFDGYRIIKTLLNCNYNETQSILVYNERHRGCRFREISEEELNNNKDFFNYYEYEQIVQNKELALLSGDTFTPVGNKIIENKSVTHKVSKYCKFNSFIEKTYKNQINSVKHLLFNGRNNFELDTVCNSCLGYVVEFYAKYLIYGQLFLNKEIVKIQNRLHTDIINDYIIVAACVNKYKELMTKAHGVTMTKLIKGISIDSLITQKYDYFVQLVKELGTKTANFIKEKLDIKPLNQDSKLHSPVLSTNYISGLCDIITQDTILDIKCTNNISIKHIKQVLGYHYLSKYRSDLNIKRVIVFDAVSGKHIEINLDK